MLCLFLALLAASPEMRKVAFSVQNLNLVVVLCHEAISQRFVQLLYETAEHNKASSLPSRRKLRVCRKHSSIPCSGRELDP